MSDGEVLAAGFLLFIGYLLPGLVAYFRNHNNCNAIAILNILFGWTFVGWGAALIWSFTDNTRKTNPDNKDNSS
jgi:hypothetical protein